MKDSAAWYPKSIVDRISNGDKSVLTIMRYCLDCGNYIRDTRENKHGFICPLCMSNRNMIARYRDVDEGDVVSNRFGSGDSKAKAGVITRTNDRLGVWCDGEIVPLDNDWWLAPDLTLRLTPPQAKFNFGQHIQVIIEEEPISVVCVGTDGRGEFYFINKEKPGKKILSGFYEGVFQEGTDEK